MYLMKCVGKLRILHGTIYIFATNTVGREFIDYVISILREFYERVGEVPEFAEVYIYGLRREKLMYIESEALSLGILAVGDFVTLHEAWRGYPRIHISVEDLQGYSQEIIRTLIVHEAAHSLLHGSLKYYFVSIIGTDDEVISSLDQQALVKAVYFASTAIKDLDVSAFLVSKGLIEDAKAYAEFSASQIHEVLNRNDIVSLLHTAKLLAPAIPLSLIHI